MLQFTQENEAMFLAGLNLIKQALTIYDHDLRLVVANARFQEMFLLPPHLTVSGARFDETIRHLAERGEYGPVQDVDEFVKQRVETARAFEPHYMERTRSNGQIISVEGAPLPQGGWITVYTDITIMKQQEDMLRSRSENLAGQLFSYSAELETKNRELEATITALAEAKRTLTDIEARTRLTTEMMPAHIAHVDRNGRYTFSNRKLSEVMPHRPKEILGRTISETLGAQAYSQIKSNLEAAFMGFNSVFEFDDSLSSRRIRTAFTPDKQGSDINGVYILSMDITEETQARVALQQASRRQMAAQLTSGLAHDFSNLLTIIMATQDRLRKLDLSQDVVNLCDTILQAARRGGSLLQSIGDMTAAQRWNPKPVNLSEMMDQFDRLARSALPEDITLSIKKTLSSEQVLLDAGLLQDALLNLVLNAKDAIQGPGKITLTVGHIQETWIEFVVSDTGHGFSEKQLKHAMDPFFTTKGDKGMGLGLSMVYDTAKSAGGTLRLGNNYRGARVTLRLPLTRVHSLDPTKIILLVEDNFSLREDMRNRIIDAGQMVVEASSYTEAVSLIETLPDIGLVLTDLQIEGSENGANLAEHAQKFGLTSVIMTSLPRDHFDFIAAQNVAPVLQKPIDDATLHQLIGNETQI